MREQKEEAQKMAFIETEARRLCGCLNCTGTRLALECEAEAIAKGLRSGLEKAAEVAARIGPMDRTDVQDAVNRIRALLTE